jgi:hypothetical protein
VADVIWSIIIGGIVAAATGSLAAGVVVGGLWFVGGLVHYHTTRRPT